MKLLMLAFDSVQLEQMPHLAWLVGTGCYGKLDAAVDGDAALRQVAEELTRAGKRVQALDVVSRQNLHAAQELLRSATCDAVQILHASGESTESVDAELGSLFESLDQETAILILWADGSELNFALTASASPLRGEMRTAQVADITPTLVELSGDIVPDWVTGKSLLAFAPPVAGNGGYTRDEEEIIRERLSGLGYIG